MLVVHHSRSRFGITLQALRNAFTRDAMDWNARQARARFRAWHRGTREADLLIGGFYDRHHAGWGENELRWFETLLDEDDVDIMAWAMTAQAVPQRLQGREMVALQRLDYAKI